MIEPQQGDRVSEYLLDERIGAGSFGQVWKAHHHVWKENVVAIKIPTDAQYVRNLQREGAVIHGLKHPNIVRAIGLDPYGDVPYLVMEFVDGPALRALIDANPKGMAIHAAQEITRGILRALEHAHANGVVHRDVKPGNILVGGANSKPAEEIDAEDVKVTDFGLGKVGAITTASILQSGSLLSEEGKSISGTLAYMAPEQRDGGTTDARSDLYAVGIVLFEMLCGVRPSGSDMPSHVREDLPSWVDPVYARLYTRYERRYESAAEALAAIDASSVPPIAKANGGERREFSPPPLPATGGDVLTCNKCGSAVDPDDNFCIICGVQLVENLRQCSKCKAYPAPQDRFCVRCGSKLPT